MLVSAELDVGGGVRAVSTDQLGCYPASFGIWKVTRSRERPKNEVSDHRNRRNSDQAHGQVEPAHFVVKRQRSRLPEEEVCGLSAQRGEGCAVTGNQNEHERQEHTRRSDEGRAQERRAPVERLVGDVERSPTEP